MKIKVEPLQNQHDPRKDIVFSGPRGTYRICGYDMLPHRMHPDGVGYTRIPWEQFRIAVTHVLAMELEEPENPEQQDMVTIL